MSQIDTNIWIGNLGDASNEQRLKENRITHILCCTDEFKHPPGFIYVTGDAATRWYCLPIVDDKVDSNTEAHFRDGAKKIDEWIQAGHTVMVHCFAGISRSVSVVLAYYIIYRGWSYDIAYLHIKSKRKQINPHPNFIPILKDLSSQQAQDEENA